MTDDPYAVLGVSRDADAATIKEAYRRAARKTHPDAGGSEAAFAPVTAAYRLLSDQRRRKAYDELGETEEADLSANAVNALIMAFDTAMRKVEEAKADPVRQDMKALMLHLLIEQREARRGAQEKAERAMRRFERLRKRFVRKGGKVNYIEIELEKRLVNLRRTAAAIEGERATIERAIEILLEYDFRQEIDPMLSWHERWTTATGTSTTSTTITTG